MSDLANAKQIQCDVLVVGLGPVGAAVSALLAHAGHRVVAVDRDTGLYSLPRAVGFDGDVMRIFQAMGLAETVSSRVRFSPFYEFVAADGTVLIRYDRSGGGHPSGWPHNVTFFQPDVEMLLRQRIEAEPSAEMMLGISFVNLVQDRAGVTTRLAAPEGEVVVRSRYVIGCDGARSEVRRACAIDLDDSGFDEPWLVVDFLSEDLVGLPDSNRQVCDPARPATYLQMGPGRYRWEFMILPGEDPEWLRREDTIRALLAERGVVRIDPIERAAVYRFHGLIARSWRQDNVLLAGDAAHQMPPFAGQGFCSGLRDAFNLAWKLDLVLTGQADAGLLDSYETERKPQVEFMVRTAIALGKIVCTTDPDRARERDAEMLANRAVGRLPPPLSYPPLGSGFLLEGSPGAGELFPQPVARSSQGIQRFDDLMGGQSTLVASRPVRGMQGDDALRVLMLSDQGVLPFAPAIEDWLKARNVEAVLLRPDSYVFGTGSPEWLLDSFRRCLASGPLATRARNVS